MLSGIRKFLLMFFMSLCVVATGSAQEQSEAFMIYAYDKSYKVVAPTSFSEGVAAIIENKTLLHLHGKFQKHDGTLIKHIALSPQSTLSVDLNLKEGELAYFVPFNPAFQEVVLRFGQRAYEIPPAQ